MLPTVFPSLQASLDMLQRIFPGDMLKTLILKACSPNGEITPDMADRLARVLEQGVTPTAAQFVALATGTGANTFGEGRSEAPVPSAAAVESLEPAGDTPFAAPGSPSSVVRSSDESARSLPEPFADYQHATLGPIKTGDGAGSPRAAAQLAGTSRTISNASAVALLRQASQVSIRTELSYMIAEDPASPYSEGSWRNPQERDCVRL